MIWKELKSTIEKMLNIHKELTHISYNVNTLLYLGRISKIFGEDILNHPDPVIQCRRYSTKRFSCLCLNYFKKKFQYSMLKYWYSPCLLPQLPQEDVSTGPIQRSEWLKNLKYRNCFLFRLRNVFFFQEVMNNIEIKLNKTCFIIKSQYLNIKKKQIFDQR
jgi:hypothetical protein